MRLNSQKIKELIKLKKLTIKGVSVQLGMHEKSLSQTLTKGTTREPVAQRLAQILDVSINEIIKLDNPVTEINNMAKELGLNFTPNISTMGLHTEELQKIIKILLHQIRELQEQADNENVSKKGGAV